MAYENLTRAIEKLATMDKRLADLATLRTLADSGAELALTNPGGLPHQAKLGKAIVLQAIDAQVQQITGTRDTLKATLDAIAAQLGAQP
jgi:hypothetical protein